MESKRYAVGIIIRIFLHLLTLDLQGIEDYVQRKGFDDHALLGFARGIIARWELFFSLVNKVVDVWQPLELSNRFIRSSLRELEKHSVDNLPENHAQLEVSIAVFKIHYFVRR